MIKFANFELIFVIRGPKLARRGIPDKLIKHKIGGLLFYLHTWNDFAGARGSVHPDPHSSPREDAGIFYLPCMIKFANFEFIFATRGPKLARRVVEDKLIKHKIGDHFFTCTRRLTLGDE